MIGGWLSRKCNSVVKIMTDWLEGDRWGMESAPLFYYDHSCNNTNVQTLAFWTPT